MTERRLHILVAGAIRRQQEVLKRRFGNLRLRFLIADDLQRGVPRGLDYVILNMRFLSHKFYRAITSKMDGDTPLITVHGGVAAIARALEELANGEARFVSRTPGTGPGKGNP